MTVGVMVRAINTTTTGTSASITVAITAVATTAVDC